MDQRRTFAPLAYSVDGIAGYEARAFEKRIASLFAAKWGREYIELVGFVRAKMAMAVVARYWISMPPAEGPGTNPDTCLVPANGHPVSMPARLKRSWPARAVSKDLL